MHEIKQEKNPYAVKLLMICNINSRRSKTSNLLKDKPKKVLNTITLERVSEGKLQLISLSAVLSRFSVALHIEG